MGILLRNPVKTGTVMEKPSTMFPDNWSEQRVLSETYEVINQVIK